MFKEKKISKKRIGKVFAQSEAPEKVIETDRKLVTANAEPGNGGGPRKIGASFGYVPQVPDFWLFFERF